MQKQILIITLILNILNPHILLCMNKNKIVRVHLQDGVVQSTKSQLANLLASTKIQRQIKDHVKSKQETNIYLNEVKLKDFQNIVPYLQETDKQKLAEKLDGFISGYIKTTAKKLGSIINTADSLKIDTILQAGYLVTYKYLIDTRYEKILKSPLLKKYNTKWNLLKCIPDGKFFTIKRNYQFNKTIELWNSQNDILLKKFQKTDFACIWNNQFLIISFPFPTNQIKVWNLQTNSLRKEWNNVISFDPGPNNFLLVQCLNEEFGQIWNLKTNQLVKEFPNIMLLSYFSPDGTKIAFAYLTHGGIGIIHDLKTKQVLKKFTNTISSFKWSNDSKKIEVKGNYTSRNNPMGCYKKLTYQIEGNKLKKIKQ